MMRGGAGGIVTETMTVAVGREMMTIGAGEGATVVTIEIEIFRSRGLLRRSRWAALSFVPTCR